MPSSAAIAPEETTPVVPGSTLPSVPPSASSLKKSLQSTAYRSKPHLKQVLTVPTRRASDGLVLVRKLSHLLLDLGSSSSAILSRRHSFVPANEPLPSVQSMTAGFFDVFGYLGVLMVVAFAFSALAMIFLAFVQLFPDEIGNLILHTQSLDNGDFLMFSQASPWLVALSAAVLLLFSSGYSALIAVMLWFRSPKLLLMVSRPSRTASIGHRILARFLAQSRVMRLIPLLATVRPSDGSPLRRKGQVHMLHRVSTVRRHLASRVIFEFTSIEGQFHEYHVAAFDVPKLIFQTVSLVLYMKEGFPLELIILYALPLVVNWTVSFYRFQREVPDPMLAISRFVYLFDLFFAVFAPIVVLVYAYNNFHMDRDTFKSREDTLTPGMFDRIAKLFADPVEVEVFRQGFSSMQITKPYYLAIKSFLNVLGIYKWKKVIVHLIAESHQRMLNTPRTVTQQNSRRRHSRRHLLLGALLFLCCSLGIAIYTIVAVVTSVNRCSHFPNCAVFSYVWHTSNDLTCPCIVFIDRDTKPRTYQQWIHALDVTEQVRALAVTGTLETLQLINRAMPEVPEELRKCTNLQTLILLYTQTQTLPEWTSEWTQMRYMHLEGDFIHYPLQYLPPDIFTHMSDLRFLRIAGAAKLKKFPSLESQQHLSTLVVTIVRSLHELPSFDRLTSLRTMILAELTHIPVLPSFEKLESLTSFTLFRRNEVCCNGYATGYCDLNNFQCLKRESEPEVHCVGARMSAEDHAVVKRVNGFLCAKNITQDIDVSEPTRHSTDGICGGVMYRECYLDGIRGICYNGRMQVVHCDVYGEYEKMRRLQIARGVGDTCDPKVEAWLGCSK